MIANRTNTGCFLYLNITYLTRLTIIITIIIIRLIIKLIKMEKCMLEFRSQNSPIRIMCIGLTDQICVAGTGGWWRWRPARERRRRWPSTGTSSSSPSPSSSSLSPSSPCPSSSRRSTWWVARRLLIKFILSRKLKCL